MKMQFKVGSAPKRRRTEAVASIFRSEAAEDNDVDQEDPVGSIDGFQQSYDRGCDLAGAGQFAAALTCFDTALRLLGIDGAGGAASEGASMRRAASLHDMRSQVLLGLDRDFEAVQAAERATHLAPDWAEGWLGLGRAQLNLGEPRLAVASLTEALELEPALAEAKRDLERATVMLRTVVETGSDPRAAAAAASAASLSEGS